ncbi:MAG: histidine kinase dimerization/phospho-acceptor domain-containing protein [Saprospiraceae bacterium]
MLSDTPNGIEQSLVTSRLNLLQGQLYLAEGNINQAAFYIDKVLDSKTLLPTGHKEEALATRIQLLLQTGDFAAAYNLLEKNHVTTNGDSYYSTRFTLLEGKLFADAGMDSLATEKLEKAQQSAIQSKDTVQWIAAHQALATLHPERGNYQLIHELALKKNEPHLTASVLLSMYEADPLATTATIWLDEALRISRIHGYEELLGKAYLLKGLQYAQCDSARYFCSKSFDIAEQLHLHALQLRACNCLQEWHANHHQWEEAYRFLNIQKGLQQSSDEANLVRKVNAAQFNETLRQAQETSRGLIQQMEARELAANAQLETQQQKLKRMSIWLLVIGILMMLSYFLYRNKARYNRELQLLNHDLQQANNKLAAANQELAQHNDALDQFAAVAAHDLKGPLRTIHSFTQLLRRRIGSSLGEEEQSYFAYITEGTTRLSNLIDSLLAFSRLGKKWTNLSPYPCKIFCNR